LSHRWCDKRTVPAAHYSRKNRDCVFAATSDFQLQRAWQPNVADFMVKSAHFVFKDNVRRSSRRSAFFAPYTVIRPAQVGTAQAGTPLKKLRFSSLFFLSFSLDCVRPRSPGEKGQQGVTGESRGHISPH